MSEQENPQFYNIFNLCLDRVLSGKRTVKQCLADYPQYASQLKHDLTLALMFQQLKKQAPQLSPGKVAAIEANLKRQSINKRRNVRFMPARMAAVFIMVILIFVSGTGGVIAASAKSNPDDTLYKVKRLWEEAIITFYNLTGVPDDIWMRLAKTRLSEVQVMYENGSLTDEMLLELQEATANLLTQEGITQEIKVFTQQTQLFIVHLEDEGHSSDTILRIYDTLNPVIVPAQPEPVIPPTFESTATSTITYTLTPTATPTATPTVTLSPTHTSTSTPTATATLTPVARFIATATTTLSPTPVPPSPTVLPSLTPVPTATWTPIRPLGGIMPFNVTAAPLLPTQPIPTRTPVSTWYPWPQATIDSFYATRTAEAFEAGN